MKFVYALLAMACVAMAVEASKNVTVDIDAAIKEVAHLAEKISYSGACQTHDCVAKYHTGDCWGMSDYIVCELKKRGVEAKIVQYPTEYSDRHRSVLYKNAKGEWVRFPYRQYNIFWKFRDTDGVDKGTPVSATCK